MQLIFPWNSAMPTTPKAGINDSFCILGPQVSSVIRYRLTHPASRPSAPSTASISDTPHRIAGIESQPGSGFPPVIPLPVCTRMFASIIRMPPMIPYSASFLLFFILNTLRSFRSFDRSIESWYREQASYSPYCNGFRRRQHLCKAEEPATAHSAADHILHGTGMA